MKVLICKFENTLYNRQLSNIHFIDANKIKEFQELGHIFGLYIEDQKISVEKVMKENGITVDFILKKDGSILFKEGYQYFDYDLLKKEDIYSILSSLKGEFEVWINTPITSFKYNEYLVLNDEKMYTSISIKNSDQTSIINQLHAKFNDGISTRVNKNSIEIFSKKNSIDKSLDVLCGLKNIKINDVYMVSDHFIDNTLIDGIPHLYALKENNESNRDIYLVNSVGECIDDIINDASHSLFLSINCV